MVPPLDQRRGQPTGPTGDIRPDRLRTPQPDCRPRGVTESPAGRLALVKATTPLQTVEVTAQGEGLVSRAGGRAGGGVGRPGGTDRESVGREWRLLWERVRRDPRRVLRDVGMMLADGGDYVTDMAALDGQERLSAPGRREDHAPGAQVGR